jgi:hypothetical protein
MERFKVLFIGVFFTLNVFGTIQIPDLLIYNGDTILIESYPLESYFNDQNLRPDSIFFKDCLSTACWRGYQAIWKIENDRLFLVSILDCCADDKLMLVDSVYEDLEELLSPEIMGTLAPFHGNYITAHFALERLRNKMGDSEFYKYRNEILKISLRTRKYVELSQIFDFNLKDAIVFAAWYNGKLKIKPKQIDSKSNKENGTTNMIPTLIFRNGILSKEQ